MKKIICFFFFFWGFCMLCNVFASIGVSPTITEISIEKGGIYEGSYIVSNSSGEELEISIEPVDWRKKYLKLDNNVEVREWLSFEEYSFILKPGEIREVFYEAKAIGKIKNEQVAQVFFAFSRKNQNKAFRTRLGVIFYLSVKGNEKLKAKIKRVKISVSKNDDKSKNIYASVEIRNKGNIHIRPHGIVRITKYGDEVERIVIKKGKGIYPKRSDKIGSGIKNVNLPSGVYRAEIEIDCSMYGIKKKLFKKKKFTI